MLTAAQIVLISLIGVLGVLSIGFMIAFIVEISRASKEQPEDSVKEVKNVFEITINENSKEDEKTESVSDMLAELDKLTEGEVEEKKEEPAKEEIVEEAIVPEEIIELSLEDAKAEEPVQEEVKEEVQEEVVEEAEQEEVSEDVVVELATDDSEELAGHGPIIPGTLIDYETRLEKVKKSRNKLKRDLEKRDKAILKYDRTIRRKDRNQRMLDRRAGELTNLNLLMYSVTDIKNVDEDKKVKQEELTAHIAELKASIQDAEEYIESNKAKHSQNKSVAKYLTQEIARYDEEIAELEALIKSLTDGAEDK